VECNVWGGIVDQRGGGALHAALENSQEELHSATADQVQTATTSTTPQHHPAPVLQAMRRHLSGSTRPKPEALCCIVCLTFHSTFRTLPSWQKKIALLVKRSFDQVVGTDCLLKCR
jgi:hypothetical protein